MSTKSARKSPSTELATAVSGPVELTRSQLMALDIRVDTESVVNIRIVEHMRQCDEALRIVEDKLRAAQTAERDANRTLSDLVDSTIAEHAKEGVTAVTDAMAEVGWTVHAWTEDAQLVEPCDDGKKRRSLKLSWTTHVSTATHNQQKRDRHSNYGNGGVSLEQETTLTAPADVKKAHRDLQKAQAHTAEVTQEKLRINQLKSQTGSLKMQANAAITTKILEATDEGQALLDAITGTGPDITTD